MVNEEKQFSEYTHKCARGHPPTTTEKVESDKQPDKELVRRYQCPKCGQIFRIEISKDGSKVESTRE